MSEFKFQLGETVYTKCGVQDARTKTACGLVATPVSSVVVGRLADECSGGVQRNYKIAVPGEVVLIHELELLAVGEFDAEAHGKQVAAIRAAESAARRAEFGFDKVAETANAVAEKMNALKKETR